MKDPKIYLKQRALAEMGFYAGILDGDAGPLTQAAYNDWIASLEGPSGDSFEELVASWNLRYFHASELLAKGGAHSRNRLNTDPPRELWGNIKLAAQAADEARHRLGSGLIITSAYRSDAYNRAIGGATGSYHRRFQALDLVPVRATVAQLHAVLSDLRRQGFKGAQGIGRYNSFCHIDNGPTRSWGG